MCDGHCFCVILGCHARSHSRSIPSRAFFFSLGHKSAAAGNYANMPRFLYATRRLGCYQHGCPGSVVVITPDWYARVVEGRGFKSRSGYYKFFFLYFFLHFNVYFNMLRIYIYKKKTLRVMGNTYSPGDSIPRDNGPPYIMLGVCLCKHARTCCYPPL